MTEYAFTKDQARTMLIAAQGFSSPPPQVGHNEVADCIRRMGILQIDTINVVARSPYLVLWSRLGDYKPKLLEDLLEMGKLFEYWSHEACFIPIEDFPYYRRLMLEKRKHPRRFEWLDDNQAAATAMLEHVRANGPAKSSDFDRTDGRKGNWWDWKSEKHALDFLHTAGDLMILRRDRFQRIYELRERVLPDWNDSAAPPYEEVLRYLVLKTVDSLGIASEGWCADYFRILKKEATRHLKQLTADGLLLPALIEGFSEPAYISTENKLLADKVLQGLELSTATLLSPFDPVVWHRKRALELFDFDYRIECYVPAPKRKYGYFVLPILIGSAIVGRLDAKAHRKEKIFEVKELFLEPGVKPDDSLIRQIGLAIQKCAIWHGASTVTVTKGPTVKLAKQIQSAAKISKRRTQDLKAPN